MNTYDSIIPQFISYDELRPALTKPHLDGDNVVATNGHILIIIPVTKLSNQYHPSEGYPGYKSILPRISSLYLSPKRILVEAAREYLQEIPKVPTVVECVSCDGFGCKKCADKGEIVIPNKYQYDWVHHKIKIGESYFNPNYIEVILNVAAVNSSKSLYQHAGGEEKPTLLSFSKRPYSRNVHMLIMPIRCRTSVGDLEVENSHEIPYEVTL